MRFLYILKRVLTRFSLLHSSLHLQSREYLRERRVDGTRLSIWPTKVQVVER